MIMLATTADAIVGVSYPNILMMLAIVFGFYMAWNIGANDVANAMATSVGSGLHAAACGADRGCTRVLRRYLPVKRLTPSGRDRRSGFIRRGKNLRVRHIRCCARPTPGC